MNTTHTILVALDGGPADADAIALAQQLAPPDGHLVLGHVWDHAAGLMAAVSGHEHPSIAARRLVEDARLAAGLDCAVVTRGATSVGAGLHRMAEEAGAELLVVGAGQAEPGHTVLSADVRAALHGAPCSLAIAPRGHAQASWTPGRIGVAHQGTAAGDRAIAAAREVAERTGGELHGITIIPPLPTAWMGEPFAYMAVLDDVTGASERRAKADLEHAGLVAHVQAGPPGRLIADWTREVDLLVIGSRGYGPARRLLFGSTADEVLRGAACPVLVTRAGDSAGGVEETTPWTQPETTEATTS